MLAALAPMLSAMCPVPSTLRFVIDEQRHA
jgi:hypothetical protein